MKRRIIRTISVLLAIVLLTSSFAGCQKEDVYEKVEDVTVTESGQVLEEEYKIPEGMNPLSGMADLPEEAYGSRPIAFMVDTTSKSLPQWGVTTPDLIIEGAIEGNATRMMWVYADAGKIPDKLGPIRSARHDFVEIAAGMNAILVHAGEGEDAKIDLTYTYQTMENLDVDNIDGAELFGQYFQKDTTRKVADEYKAYTTKGYINSAIEKFEYTTKQTASVWTPYNIVLGEQSILWGDKSVTRPGNELLVTFSRSHIYVFKYDETDQRYYTYLNDVIVKDGNNEAELAFENIIVLYSYVSDLELTASQKDWNLEETSGSGFYVSNGIAQKVYWSKGGKNAPLQIRNVEGRKIQLNPGRTWMGIVPRSSANKVQVVR